MIVQTIAPEVSGGIGRVERVRVYVKRTWTEGWDLAPYLYPVSASCQTFPGIGRAQFEYDYGYMARPDRIGFSVYRPLDLAGYFVQVAAVGYSGEEVLWTGVLDLDSQAVDGSTAHGQTGRQVLQGYEVGHLFDRVTLTQCAAWDTRLLAVVEVGSLPDFNHKGLVGLSALGNRSAGKATAPGGGESYVFGGSGVWSNLDILEYLLTWHGVSPFSVTLSGQYAALAGIQEVHRFEGMTLWHTLGELIDRRRGLGFRLFPMEDGTLSLDIFSVLGTPLSFGDVTIPANPNRVPNLRLDTDTAIDTCLFHNSEATVFDEVEVIGEPIVSCFTLAYENGSLVKGWVDSEGLAYAQLTELGNNCTDAETNDKVRSSDGYKRVFQFHKMNPAWDGIQTTTYGSFPVFPKCLPNGALDVLTSAGFIRSFKAFERSLPFSKEAAISDAEPEHVEPLVVFLYEPVAGPMNYMVQADADGESKCSVRVTDGELGLMVEPSLNHVMGLTWFDVVEGSSTASKKVPLVNYTTIKATVSLKTDENLRVLISARPVVEGRIRRRLTIKTDGELWYVVPGTVVGLKGGAGGTIDLDLTAGGVVYDDSPRLRQIALMAAAWYGQERLAIQVGWRKLTVPAPIGSYIDSVTAGSRRDAGTVVTALEFDFLKCRTELRTSYLDLDFLTSIAKGDRKFSMYDRRLRRLERRGNNLVDRGGAGGGGTTINRNGDWLATATGD